jgi:hypothetical protein
LNVKRKYSYSVIKEEIWKQGIYLNALKKKNKYKEKTIEITEELFNCIPGMKESGWTYKYYKIQWENEKQEITLIFWYNVEIYYIILILLLFIYNFV